MHRIIRKAGLTPWPKTFQNLRSTRETELADAFPIHCVCKWIGNSQAVAREHYLQLTDDQFDRAAAVMTGTSGEAAQNAAQKLHETVGNGEKAARDENAKTPVIAGVFESFPSIAGHANKNQTPREQPSS
jgi:hypothetical protein